MSDTANIKPIGEITNIEYLGDGAYIGVHKTDYVIFAYDGESAYEKIFLEPPVMDKLFNYLVDERERLAQLREVEK